MKHLNTIIIVAFLFLTNSLSAQSGNEIEVGEVLEIGHSKDYQYSHVKFPKPNFIIKKGGRVDYGKLAGVLVEVTKVKTNNLGETKVILRRKDGKKFFGSFPEVTANYTKAIASNELKK